MNTYYVTKNVTFDTNNANKNKKNHKLIQLQGVRGVLWLGSSINKLNFTPQYPFLDQIFRFRQILEEEINY